MAYARMLSRSYRGFQTQYPWGNPGMFEGGLGIFNLGQRINLLQQLNNNNTGNINVIQNIVTGLVNNLPAVEVPSNSNTLKINDTLLLEDNSGNTCTSGLDNSGNFNIVTSGITTINSLFQNSIWPVTQNAYNNNQVYSYSDPSATLIGNSYGGENKWVGGVVAPNGKIYCIPSNAANVLIIDPVNNTDTSSNFGLDLSGNGKWWGGCLGSNGRIFAIPQNETRVLVINPSTNTATLTNFGLDLSNNWGSNKWTGGVVGLNGKIYCIPTNATKVLVINPSNETAVLTDFGLNLSGDSKWWGGAMGPDGKIYCIPVSVSDFLIIDTLNDTAIRSNLGLTIPGGFPWLGAVLGSDGKIYGVPFGTVSPGPPGVLIIDTNKQIATINNFGINFADGTTKWTGGCLGPDGRIYCAPEGASNFLIIDPVKQTAIRDTLGVNITGAPNTRYRGCVLAENGSIYMIPFRRSQVCKITHPSATPYNSFITRHPVLNKF